MRITDARALIVAGLALVASPVAAQDMFAEMQEQCSACHAQENAAPDAPLLGGIDERYALLQLVAFREGDRKNEIMNGMVADFSNDDLRAAAAWVAGLERPTPPEDPAEVDAGSAEQLASQHRCNVCHGSDYLGGDQMPPLRNQHQGYLEKALLDYKAERRIGDRAAMVEVAQDLSEDEIATLAAYLSGLPAMAE